MKGFTIKSETLLKSIIFAIVFIFSLCYFPTHVMAAEILTLKKKVKDLFDEGKREEAVTLIKDALITADAGDASEQIQRLMLQYLAWGGEYDEALEGINIVLKRSPNNVDILFLKAKILTWKPDYKAANEVYEKIESLQGSNEEIYYNNAMMLIQADNPIKASKICKKIQTIQKDCKQKVLAYYIDKRQFAVALEYQNQNPELDKVTPFSLFSFSMAYDYSLVKNNENLTTLSVQGGYSPSLKFASLVELGFATRHEDKDVFIRPEIYYRPYDKINTYTLGSYALPHGFSPHFKLVHQWEIDVYEKTQALVSMGYTRFDTDEVSGSGNIYIPSLGGAYYLFEWLVLKYQLYLSYDFLGEWIDSHLIKIELPISRDYIISTGYAHGGESYNIVSLYEVGELTDNTIFTYGRIYFSESVGMVYALTYSNRSNGSDMLAVKLGTALRF